LGGVVVMVAVYALANRLYRSRAVALAALALIAFSPYAVTYAPTALTDSLMLPLSLLGLAAVARGHDGRAGGWLGLACLAKQQALYFVPLAAALAWVCDERSRVTSRLIRLALPVALALLVLALWDAARDQPTSLWALAAANNAPGRLI